MPTYTYACDTCKHTFEEFRSITKPHPKACPKCGEKGEPFHQDYSQCSQVGWVYGNPTTIGQQADINARNLGKEQMQLMREDEKRKRSDIKLPKGVKLDDTTPATPFWRDGSIEGVKKLDKPLNVEKVPDVNKYIQTGQGV